MKKILSIILAAAMLLALCPAVFAAETTKEFTGYNYVFTREALKSETDIAQNDLANYTFESVDRNISAPWKFASVHRVASTLKTDCFKLEATRKNGESCFAIELEIKQGGKYIPKLEYIRSDQTGIVDIYLAKEGMDFKYGSIDINTSDLSNVDSLASQNYGSTYNIPYYFTNGFPEGTDGAYVLKTDLDMYTGSGSDTVEDFGKRELTLEDNTSYYLIFRIKSAHQDIMNAGKIWYVWLDSFSLEYVRSEADEAFDYTAEEYKTPDATTVTRFTYCNGEVEKIDESPITATYGTPVEIPAVNKTITDGDKTYNFLYWAKGLSTGLGNKNVLSTTTGFNYFPQEGANYLIAVYEEVGTEETATFYNANGQLLQLNTDNGKLPELPSMAGYTEAAASWVQLGTNDEFGADKLVSEISGEKIFMAKYNEDKKASISVTVNGASSDSTPTNTYAYGKKVICKTATPAGKVFMYWTKTVDGANEAEIVSMNEEYSFYAWEDCVVTAEYGDAKPSLAKDMRKIIISSVEAGNENAIMAEFIGLGDALEKGVMIGSRKIAMTTDNPQFTVVVGAGDTVTGYAIVGNATDGYKQITDK